MVAATGCRAKDGLGGRKLFNCAVPHSPEVRQRLKSRSRYSTVVVCRLSVCPRQHQGAHHRTSVLTRTGGGGQSTNIYKR